MAKLIYSGHYDIGFFGLERLHPFDSRKYSRAWKLIRKSLGGKLREHVIAVDRAANDDELQLVHTPEYLAAIREPAALAAAVELPFVRRAPRWLAFRQILRPMRWATRGTVLAARAALEHGLAINLAGGYHHAKPAAGEGFCIYSDIALAVQQLRQERRIDGQGRVVYIDLDAHQGNGVCHQFMNDAAVFIFDAYNSEIYPSYDIAARDRIDCDVPLPAGCDGAEYLDAISSRLPGFLESACRQPPALAIYNAGTDVFEGDPLGQMNLAREHILERDLFVVEQLRGRGIPTLMLPSGGYTRESFRLMASSILKLLARRLAT